jgi:hypothetical protein
MNLNDAGDGSLRQAILDTPAGGTVDFDPGLSGTIALSTGELAVTKDLTIAGPGADTITVSGSHASRVFNIAATYAVGISGLTIADGNVVGANGGGILSAGTLALNDCIVSNNSAANGGGIFSNRTLTVSNSAISDNSVSSFGEGSAVFSVGQVNLSDSAISGNRGGIIAVCYINGGTVTVSNCSLTSNPSLQACIEGNGTLTVSNSTIAGNGGYGVWNGSGTATVSNSTIAGNAGYGFRNSQRLTVSNSTIAGNSLGGIEDIAFSINSTAMLVSTSVADNGGHQLVAQSGYGMPQGTATIQLRNTIVSSDGHSANLAAGLAGTFSSMGYNLSSDGGGGFLTAPGDLTNTDPRLGPLQDNGGPTQTRALLAGSPALGAGDPAESGVADQRGVVRSGGVNIGAYQASADHLVFLQQPTDTAAGDTMAAVIVEIVDQFGNVVIGDNTDTITLSVGNNAGGGTLSGTLTLTVTNGVATFSDLSIDLPGTGYTLSATTSGSLPDIDSDPFDIS